MEWPAQGSDRLTTVLVDIGGVLYVDPWETVLLTPDSGIADRLGLSRYAVDAAAQRLWPEFSTKETQENHYWGRLFESLGTRFRDVVDLVEQCSDELLRPLPLAESILTRLSANFELGVVTDNTTFWYLRQEDELSLLDFVREDLIFVSSTAGFCKDGDPSLFDLAGEHCRPASTLVIDDRQSKLDRAAQVGFRTLAAAQLAEIIGDPGAERRDS